ncbi:hypothetical protein C7293_14360 [filamentous cyanobacterium CCT1]|nr:hypothetical protein C7293_14360 [filamentous cyanobacterium CCT1]PSN80432.1 hypothetical protein C8B47_06480 [filamentous cyanobacterium CCP4]
MATWDSVVFPTLGEAFRAYGQALATDLEASSNSVNLARMAVLKFTVPGLGGPAQKGKRMTAAEQAAALSFLDGVSVELVATLPEVQRQVFDSLQTAEGIRKTNRYQLRRFLDWMQEQRLAKAVALVETQERQQTKPPKQIHHKGRYGLQPQQWPPALRADFEAFEVFGCSPLGLNLRPASYNCFVGNLNRLLGWLHHIEGEPLESLTFSRLIRLVPLSPNDAELTAVQRFLEQNRLHDAGAEAASEASALLNHYFDFHAGSLSTQRVIAQALLAVAKFVYRAEIERLGLNQGLELNCVPVIRRLRQIYQERCKAEKAAPPVIDYASRSIPWEEAVQVLLQMRQAVDTVIAQYEQSRYIIGKKKGQPKRSLKRVGRDLQRFLIIGFFIVLPPDRNRTVRELEMDRTLLLGRLEGGLFTPAQRLPLGIEPRWYIYLAKDDYKTAKFYGESWIEVPDTPLGNNLGFYHYLDLWIREYRPLFSPNHKVLFVTTNQRKKTAPGKPQGRANLTQRVISEFEKYAGVPVSPQKLRSMYVTQLKSLGVESHVLESAAVAMHHSRAMQDRVYDRQPQPEKIQPILDFNLQLFELIFVAEEQPLPLMEDGKIDFAALTREQQELLQKGLAHEAKRRQGGRLSVNFGGL